MLGSSNLGGSVTSLSRGAVPPLAVSAISVVPSLCGELCGLMATGREELLLVPVFVKSRIIGLDDGDTLLLADALELGPMLRSRRSGSATRPIDTHGVEIGRAHV